MVGIFYFKNNDVNPIRGGILWSGVEAGGGGGGVFRPLFYPLTTYANEIKFGTVIIHYIINNLVKKIDLLRVDFAVVSKIICTSDIFCKK